MSGHIRRRGKRSWEIKFDTGAGTSERATKYYSVKGTKRDAQAKLTEFLNEAARGTLVDPSKETLGAFLGRWERDWASNNTSRKTAERYGELIRSYVIPHVGGMPIQRLRPAHLVSLYSKLQVSGGQNGGPLSARTVGHVHRVLHRALGLATTWNVTATNSAAAVKPPPVPSVEISILTDEQIGALLRHLNGRTLRPIVSFLIGTGCRRGEALALRWSDVDFDQGAIRIERSLEQTKAGLRVKEPKTRTGRRTIAISPWLVAELHQHRIRQNERRLALGMGRAPDNSLVFARYDGRPRVPFSITRDFAVALKALGITGRTLHSLRHTHVSQLIAAGMDVLTISRRIGHASAAITLGIYGHLIAGQDARAAEITQRMFTEIAD